MIIINATVKFILIPAVRKMEYSLYKLYLVTAAQGNGGVKNERVAEFLAKMLPELQGQTEWRDWFSKYLQEYILGIPLVLQFNDTQKNLGAQK